MLKSKYNNRWDKLSKECIRVKCPTGDGLLPIVKYVRDPKSGQVHKEITGYTNLQERMNKEAKEINLISLLQEVDAGRRERVKGFSNASSLPQNKYEARKSVEKFINYWDKNPLLRLVYKSKEELLADVNANVDVYAKVKKYSDGLINNVKTESNPPVKEVVKQDQPKVDTPKSDGAITKGDK